MAVFGFRFFPDKILLWFPGVDVKKAHRGSLDSVSEIKIQKPPKSEKITLAKKFHCKDYSLVIEL